MYVAQAQFPIYVYNYIVDKSRRYIPSSVPATLLTLPSTDLPPTFPTVTRLLSESPLFHLVRQAEDLPGLMDKVVVVEGDLIPAGDASLEPLLLLGGRCLSETTVKAPQPNSMSSSLNSSVSDCTSDDINHPPHSPVSALLTPGIAARQPSVPLKKTTSVCGGADADDSQRTSRKRLDPLGRLFLLGSCFKGETKHDLSDHPAVCKGNLSPQTADAPDSPGVPANPLLALLGLSEGCDKVDQLLATTTHVIHCAAR